MRQRDVVGIRRLRQTGLELHHLHDNSRHPGLGAGRVSAPRFAGIKPQAATRNHCEPRAPPLPVGARSRVQKFLVCRSSILGRKCRTIRRVADPDHRGSRSRHLVDPGRNEAFPGVRKHAFDFRPRRRSSCRPPAAASASASLSRSPPSASTNRMRIDATFAEPCQVVLHQAIVQPVRLRVRRASHAVTGAQMVRVPASARFVVALIGRLARSGATDSLRPASANLSTAVVDRCPSSALVAHLS